MMKAGTPEKVDQDAIGTGPFKLVSYQKDSVIRFAANPNYWRGKQKIDQLVYAITTDPSVRKAKLEAHECDVANSPAPARPARPREESSGDGHEGRRHERVLHLDEHDEEAVR